MFFFLFPYMSQLYYIHHSIKKRGSVNPLFLNYKEARHPDVGTALVAPLLCSGGTNSELFGFVGSIEEPLSSASSSLTICSGDCCCKLVDVIESKSNPNLSVIALASFSH